MPDAVNTLLDKSFARIAKELRNKDVPPVSSADWDKRKSSLIQSMYGAMGEPAPAKAEPPNAKFLGVIPREGYSIEKLVIESRPGMFVTANAYVPVAAINGAKVPAVLVVHGHWAFARRDPVVQARCIGLAKLGFLALAVDAFGAGERYTNPARGTYHGGLYGATLWPAGRSLLGMQVHDNRRAVDYLLSRKDVDGNIGITGASGGGNQTMYAGALDDRIGCVVPVCSVGNYQSYLRAACCVCEVLPGALMFTEEGDVLSLVAPRGLLVINASRDANQFSPEEARKSLERAKHTFTMLGHPDRVKHVIIESGHDYNKQMREEMYGWMTRFLKKQGDGSAIKEPEFETLAPEELACYPKDNRPKEIVYPPAFAALAAREKLKIKTPTHPEAWIAQATLWKRNLVEFLSLGTVPKPVAVTGKSEDAGDFTTTAITLNGEGGIPIPLRLRTPRKKPQADPCILLHFDGKEEALKHPVANALAKAGWAVVAPDLRGCGETKPERDAIAGAPDHNSAEHAIWVGRPMLGQWLTDLQSLFGWLALNKPKEVAVVGIGHAGVVALLSRSLPGSPVTRIATFGSPATLVTEVAYGTGTPMGLLAPGLFNHGDVPHFAALAAPVPVLIADAVRPEGGKMSQVELDATFAYPKAVFKLAGIADRLKLVQNLRAEDVPNW